MGGNAFAAFDHLVSGGAQCAAADHHAARSIGAAADRDVVGVGLRQMDLVLRDAEPVGDHLRIGRLVSLPMRQSAGENRQFAARVEAQFHALVEDTGIVDVVGDAAARVLAGGLAASMPLGIAVPVGQGLALGHRRGVVAGVVDPAGARLVGVRVGTDQVLLAQFGGSIRISRAAWSTRRSMMYTASGRPAPR